jgi:acetyl esterase/lipase
VPIDPRAVLHRPAPLPDVTVAYGHLPDQVVDIRLPVPPADPDRPLVVVVHGGFWRAAYDRAHTAPLASDLASQGWPVATIEYRRTGTPGGGWPGTFDDVAAAIGAAPDAVSTAAVARGLPAPPGPPILLGHSAGGQLALWYAATAPERVRGVLALAPVADLTEAYARDLDAGAVAELLGGGPDEVPGRYAEADPCARLPLPVPAVILHGDRDTKVPIALSRAYLAAALKSGGMATLVELAGMEHFGLIDPQSTAWPSVTSALRSIYRRSFCIDAPTGTR